MWCRNTFSRIVEKISESRAGSRRRVHIQTTTWASDSHGLFDYESSNVFHKGFQLNCSSDSYCAIRDGSNVNFFREDAALEYLKLQPKAVLLVKLFFKEDGFYLLPGNAVVPCSSSKPEQKGASERLWLVIRSTGSGVRVSNGDVLKLGRFKLRLKEAVVTPEQASKASSTNEFDQNLNQGDASSVEPNYADLLEKSTTVPLLEQDCKEVEFHSCKISTALTDLGGTNEDKQSEYTFSVASDTSTKLQLCNSTYDNVVYKSPMRNVEEYSWRICRICLSNSEDLRNPFISPCHCKGSMKYVHIQCLRTWMEGRLEVNPSQNGGKTAFFWRTLDCELCKHPYPTFVIAASRKIELLRIALPVFPYLILEPPPNRHGVYVVSFASRRTARIGRGHDSDIRLTDISVSRLHATIKYRKGDFFVEDQLSKFGTLLEIQNAYKVEIQSNGLLLQVGRTVMSIHIKKKWNWYSLCSHESPQENDIYSFDVPRWCPRSARHSLSHA